METSRRSIALASGLLLIILLGVWWLDTHHLQPSPLTPTLTGKTEYCLTCHSDLPEISASHPIEAFGCVVCHGGEGLALDAELAHSTIRGGNNPSDLAVVEQSCGGSECHSGDSADSRDHIQRVMTSIQATYAGAITNIRYSFGAQTDLVAQQGIFAISDEHITTTTGVPILSAFDPLAETSTALHQFADNCLSCHISAQPSHDHDDFARLTGCASCHTPDINTYPDGQIHRLTTAIPYTQCNTCHNRGNYDLRSMTFVERTDQPLDRKSDYYQPISQFTKCEWTLDCVDCHTRNESMGDGDIHSNQHDIQYVQCKTCHGTVDELPQTHTIVSEDDLALRMSFLNPVMDLQIGDTIIVTEQGEPLWNTRVLSDGTYEMIGKATGQQFNFSPVKDSLCQQNPTEQTSNYCHECHAEER